MTRHLPDTASPVTEARLSAQCIAVIAASPLEKLTEDDLERIRRHARACIGFLGVALEGGMR